MNESYINQRVLVQKRSLGVQKANVSDLLDTVISTLMNYIKTREKCFEWDRDNKKYTFIRVNDMTDNCRVGVAFAPAGLYVRHSFVFDDERIGVVVARKSIDT